jgi:CheY-like chemotaxis protein
LDSGGLQGTKFLVIDDDARNTYAMRALLEGRRAAVVVAASGRDGLLQLAKTPGIDIVLMDIMMPDMDGYETIRILRTIDRFKTLPIIAVTGKVVDGERERCLAAGANGYVPKPVDPSHLFTVVGPWLRDPTPFT